MITILIKFRGVSFKAGHWGAPMVLAKKKRDFDPKEFLAIIGEGRKVMAFPKKETIFTQGGSD
jgi:hypothetical protein